MCFPITSKRMKYLEIHVILPQVQNLDSESYKTLRKETEDLHKWNSLRSRGEDLMLLARQYSSSVYRFNAASANIAAGFSLLFYFLLAVIGQLLLQCTRKCARDPEQPNQSRKKELSWRIHTSQELSGAGLHRRDT